MECFNNSAISLDKEYSDIIEPRYWLDNPEQRLIWAIIERAVRDVLGNQNTEIEAAAEWIWSDDISMFSFIWCCESVNADAGQIKAKIARSREKNKRNPARLAA